MFTVDQRVGKIVAVPGSRSVGLVVAAVLLGDVLRVARLASCGDDHRLGSCDVLCVMPGFSLSALTYRFSCAWRRRVRR